MSRRLRLYFHRVVDTLPSNMPKMIEYLIMLISIMILTHSIFKVLKMVARKEHIPCIETDPFIEQIDLIRLKEICWNCMQSI